VAHVTLQERRLCPLGVGPRAEPPRRAENPASASDRYGRGQEVSPARATAENRLKYGGFRPIFRPLPDENAVQVSGAIFAVSVRQR